MKDRRASKIAKKMKVGAMKKINEKGILSQKTFSPEISCRTVSPFFVDSAFPFSFLSWTATSGSISFVEKKFQKGARKK